MGNTSDRGYRILLAHRNDDVLRSLKDFFEKQDNGFAVSTSTTESEALRAIEERGIDVVIGGSNLEDCSGIELLKQAKNKGTQTTAFVLFLGDEPPERAKEAIEAGVTDYLRMTAEEFVAGIEDPGQEQHGFLASRVRNLVDRERMRTNYHEIFDKANDGIFVHDAETGEILSANESVCKMYGYSKEELLELEVGDITSETHTQQEAMAKLKEARQEGSQVFEWNAKKKSGETLPVEVSLKHAIIGGQDRILAIVRDITEQKKYKRELERKNDLLGNTEEMADIGGWEADTASGELRWTQGTRDIHEVSEEYEPNIEEAIEFYHPEDREAIREAVENCRDEGEPYEEELRLITAQDRLRWVSTRGERVEGERDTAKLRGAIQDITERKKREKKLRDSEERYRALVEQNLVGIYIVKDGVFEYVNPKMAEMIGTTPEEVIGTSPLKYVPKEKDREKMKENIKKRERGEVDSLRYSFTAKTVDGEEKTLEVHGTRVELADGPAISGAIVDMTEEIEREKKLRMQKDFTENAFDALQDIFVVVRPDGSVVDCNQTFLDTMGYDEVEAKEMTAFDLVEGEKDTTLVRGSIEDATETGTATLEVDMITKYGDKVRIGWKGSTLYHPEEGRVICGIGRVVNNP